MENEISSTTLTGQSAQQFGSGAQWGFASLMIGSVVFVASPVLLVFNTIFMGVRHQVPIGLAWVASLIGIVTILAIAITSIVFGTRGWLIANREQECGALPVTGTFMSIAAVVSWLIVSIDLIVILAS
jgi:hypothetical protein